MKTLIWVLPATFVLTACGAEEVSETPAAADVEALERSVDDCFDDYRACTRSCGFDWTCRSACLDDLFVCFDSSNPGDGGGDGGSSSCSSSRSSNGETLGADCDNGECTCTVNGVEVGTCDGDSCDLDTGCCADFF